MIKQLRLLFDGFTTLLIAVLATATLFPASGALAVFFHKATIAAIALLFFMHGAKLSREAILSGIGHWRLHLVVLGCTFVVFPLLGLASQPVLRPFLGESLLMGVMFLCVLPGTVQSAIAFTSLAGGNVPAAICSASASSIIGIVLTPVLVSVLMNTGSGAGAVKLNSIFVIGGQLLVPFVAGHLMRPLIGDFVDRHGRTLAGVDQASILLLVYTAISSSVVEGLWRTVNVQQSIALSVACCLLLALIIAATAWLGARLGFDREDRITIVFCGSKKSMANGVPMASVLFAGATLGHVLLPLMIFHQIQLMVCAVLARHYALDGHEEIQK